ncbi:PaREP1 family protein [Acidianus sp.]|uniref:PaREP1 family protein n=1 Tax=Acidianus sp. TaxID=1872104 RepID=UPI00397A744F
MSVYSTKLQIETWIKEADDLLEKGDIVQASEKYYKAVEEGIKLLVIKKGLNCIINEVIRKRGWKSEILYKASRRLSIILSENILKCWRDAYYFHTLGFHEMVLNVEKMKAKLKDFKYELEYLLSPI